MTNPVAKAVVAVALSLLVAGTVLSQVQAPTRVSSYDWACLATVACLHPSVGPLDSPGNNVRRPLHLDCCRCIETGKFTTGATGNA